MLTAGDVASVDVDPLIESEDTAIDGVDDAEEKDEGREIIGDISASSTL